MAQPKQRFTGKPLEAPKIALKLTFPSTLQSAFPKVASRNSIGIPLDTVSAFVLEYSAEDRAPVQFKVVPVGCVGELAIGGFQLARGYINRPEQTSAAFIESPWGRLYRTGDKARMRSDGTIECLGRMNDAQVKLNGQRIELGEIDQVILRTRGCHTAFAAVISNVLVAFVAVHDSESDGIRTQILANCKSWLPSFMIPADIQVMKSFPQLPSGKIDRKRLIADYERSISDDESIETRSEDDLERQLCEIGTRVLGSLVTPKSRLASAGLDSLVAIQYASSLRESGILVNTIDILDSPTIRDLSRAIRCVSTESGPVVTGKPINGHVENTQRISSDWHSELGLLIDKIERADPCTTLQTSMIVETLKDHRLYINQVELEYPREVATASVKSWLSMITQQNEILRTGFHHIESSLHQIIWKNIDEHIRIVDDFSPFSSPDIEEFIRHPLRVDIREPREKEDNGKVRITLHHSIYDGWTIDLLIEDLSILSSGSRLPDRPQFNLTSKHSGVTSEHQLMKAKEYWADYLRGSAASSPPNFRTTAVSPPEICTNISQILVNPREVKQRMVQSSFGPQVVFQACIGWLWAAVTGSDDVILGSVSSGRTIPIAGVEKMMGPLINTLPLRISLKHCRTIGELLRVIHIANRDNLRHEALPLAEVKRAAGLQANTKLFDVLFVYQESLLSRRKSPSGFREVWHKDAVESNLLVEFLPLEDHYACQMTWHSNVYSQDQIRMFACHLDTLAKFFVHHPDEPLDVIASCFPIESLSQYNKQPVCIDVLPSLSELVEKTALLYPNHEALVFADSISTSIADSQSLTYSQLNARANQIGRYLQQYNPSPGDVIAIVMEKSVLMYCSILGILKTGCAYLPILPSTPIDRINLVLQQAAPHLCLVDQSSYQLTPTILYNTVNIGDISLSGYASSNLGISGDPERLAYVIYTSGTTGAPKGVSVTNRNILSNIEVLSHLYPHAASDRMLQACSQAFDVSVFEIFFTWANGMCLCSATNDTLFEDLENAVKTLEVTHLSMTVTVASLISPRNVSKVKFLVTSGEPMTDEVLDKWADRLYQGKHLPTPSRLLANIYRIRSFGDNKHLHCKKGIIWRLITVPWMVL